MNKATSYILIAWKFIDLLCGLIYGVIAARDRPLQHMNITYTMMCRALIVHLQYNLDDLQNSLDWVETLSKQL